MDLGAAPTVIWFAWFGFGSIITWTFLHCRGEHPELVSGC
jgi:hypothetical protein